MSRPWNAVSHIGCDELVLDVCATNGCTRAPVKMTLHCDPCWDAIEREKWEENEERKYDAAKDEGRL